MNNFETIYNNIIDMYRSAIEAAAVVRDLNIENGSNKNMEITKYNERVKIYNDRIETFEIMTRYLIRSFMKDDVDNKTIDIDKFFEKNNLIILNSPK